MNIPVTTRIVSLPALALLENRGQSVTAPQQPLLHTQLRKPEAAAYAPSLPSYAVTQRQQVMAYAVIDSLGRNLMQPTGETVNLNV